MRGERKLQITSKVAKVEATTEAGTIRGNPGLSHKGAVFSDLFKPVLNIKEPSMEDQDYSGADM